MRPVPPRTLRARLTLGLVVLLAVSCAAVGVAAVLGLRGFLTGRLDEQLTEAGNRFAVSLEHKGEAVPGDGGGDNDADDRGDTRHQAIGTFGARLVDGTATHAAVVRPSGTKDVTLT
ncbi:MAG: two-component sensor histidine kinase, partial [Streptomyces sp.]|nr:two-component sensor histidine kinase [Streptomyces sp.]